MSLALLRKELREHGWVMAAMLVLDALMLTSLLSRASDDGGRFIALTRFTAAGGTLTAVVLAGRLFVREYAARTQLWLEVLPLGRGRVLATKWALGAGSQVLLVTTAWAITLWWQRRTEVISLHDAARALLATLAFALACWAFAAMTALLGRYRYLAWLLLGLVALALNQVANVPLSQVPLLGLVNEASATARTPPSVLALLQAALATLGGLAAAVALTVPGAGAVAALLSTRMTTRERAFVVASLLVAAVLVSEVKRTPEKPPFTLVNAAHAAAQHAVVGVQPAEGLDEDRARALANHVADDLDTLSAALGLEGRPRVFVLPQRGLDREVVERARLGEAEGIVLGAAPDADELDVRTAVLHAVLDDATHGRAEKEDRHVLLDGLAAWWPRRADAAARARHWQRAAAAGPATAATLEAWDTTSEQLGPCVSMALAFATVDTLVTQLGRPAAMGLLTEVFTPTRGDVRVLGERSPASRLEAAGLGWAALAEGVTIGQRAARLERPIATARVVATAGPRGRSLEATVDGADTWSVRAGRLGPWTRRAPDTLRFDARGPQATVPLSVVAGERVWAAVEVPDEALGCRVRVFSARLEVP
jgi:hypothetical protein